MPIKKCVNAEGKKGYSWGDGGCQVAGSDLESKKQAIRVGLKVEGPTKFKKIMEHDGAKAFAGYDGLQFAKAVYSQENPHGRSDELLHGIASYLSKSDDGQNSSDVDRGSMLDQNKKDNDNKHAELIENGSSLSNNPSKTGDGSGNQFVGEHEDKADMDSPSFNGPSMTMSGFPDDSSKTPPHKRNTTTNDKDQTQADAKDGDGSDKEIDTDTSDPVNTDSNLEKNRDNPGGLITTPPYNKKASPETQETPVKDGESPYPVVTRDDMKVDQPDNRGVKDDKKQYTTGTENLYQAMYLAEWVYGYISQETRDNIDSNNFAGPGSTYPIRPGHPEDVKHAAELLHHSKDPEHTKRGIKRLAKKFGYSLPESWSSDKADDKLDWQERAGNGI